jgi:hypothetical protein
LVAVDPLPESVRQLLGDLSVQFDSAYDRKTDQE